MQVFTYHHVLTVISDYTSLVDINSQLPRLKRLIEKAGMQIQPIQQVTPLRQTLEVHNGIATLPCMAFRLLRVQDESGRQIPYTHNPSQVRPQNLKEGRVQVIYYAYPFVEDEEGTKDLMLHEGQLDYCAWFAIVNVVRDEVAEGKLNPNIYEEYKENMTAAAIRARATSRSMSLDDIEHAIGLMRQAGYLYARAR
jgi:hypothetical protein